MIEVSFIIVNWNAEDFLEKCLASIYQQVRGLSFEVIVVDNASTDGSPEMVRENFPEVRLICSSTNLGFARGNNLGIRESRGRYLCLVNSDVEILKDCVQTMVAYLNRHAEIGMLGPRVLNPDGTLQNSYRSFPTLWNNLTCALALPNLLPNSRLLGSLFLTFFQGDEIRPVEVITGIFWLIRRQALEEVGLLDEDFFMYSEDTDWCRRFRQKGWEIVYFCEAQIIHYGGGSSANAPIKYYLELHRSQIQYWQKYHNKLSQKAFFLILLMHHIFRMISWKVVHLVKGSGNPEIEFKIKREIALSRWLLGMLR